MDTSQALPHAETRLSTTISEHWEYRHTAITDVGQRRSSNEDYYLLHPQRRLFIVADGMGGHAAGEVASQMTSETVAAYFDETDLPGPPPESPGANGLHRHLIQAITIANASVFQEATENTERAGMGTTVVALTFCGDYAYWGHVGDSRLYLLRNDRLLGLTRDHTLLEQIVESQELAGDEARYFRENFPRKNVLTRAVGSRYQIDVDVAAAAVQDNDLFLLTSDGVHDVLNDEEIAEVLKTHRSDLPEAAREIVAAANQAGGPDNITAVFIEARRRTS